MREPERPNFRVKVEKVEPKQSGTKLGLIRLIVFPFALVIYALILMSFVYAVNDWWPSVPTMSFGTAMILSVIRWAAMVIFQFLRNLAKVNKSGEEVKS